MYHNVGATPAAPGASKTLKRRKRLKGRPAQHLPSVQPDIQVHSNFNHVNTNQDTIITISSSRGLLGLPVELLYEILLFSRSPTLPNISRHLKGVYAASPNSFKAQYIAEMTLNDGALADKPARTMSRWLRFGICDLPVLSILERKYGKYLHWTDPGSEEGQGLVELPKRLFRYLEPQPPSIPRCISHGQRNSTDPLPLVQHLFSPREIAAARRSPSEHEPPPKWKEAAGNLTASRTPCAPHHPVPLGNPNSCDGYPLIRATYASHKSLLLLLLQHGADPGIKNGLAVKIAAGKKDLALVKLLVDSESWAAPVTQAMLLEAVKADARDIVDYFVKEQGCVPDMYTLRTMMKRRPVGR